MQIIKEIDHVCLKNTVITTGNFDGVHVGHQFLLRQLVALAKERDRPSVVVMFYPHPREVLASEPNTFSYLSSQQSKYDIFEQCGVEVVVEVPFDAAMARWTAEEFVRHVLIDKLGMSLFLVGYDHRLGNPQSDTRVLPLAEKYGFEMQECRSFETDFGPVSSSIVREHLLAGDVQGAAQLLGRSYVIPCGVVKGKKVGRSIGYPTANLKPVFDKQLLPGEGVYAVKVSIDGCAYGGMMQLGHRPTLNDGRGLTLEVHIFDFEADIYGQILDLYFIDFIRNNQKFLDLQSLQSQLREDELKVRSILQNL